MAVLVPFVPALTLLPQQSALPLPFALSDFMLTPDPSPPPQQQKKRASKADSLDLTLDDAKEPEPEGGACVIVLDGPTAAAAVTPAKQPLDDSVCIPESPALRDRSNGGSLNVSFTSEVEHKSANASPSVPRVLHTISSLLAEAAGDGGAGGEAKHDNDGEDAAVAALDDSVSVNSSQPGLDRAMIDEDGASPIAKASSARADASVAEDERKGDAPVSKQLSAATLAAFTSARAIIELLSDGEDAEDDSPAAAEPPASTPRSFVTSRPRFASAFASAHSPAAQGYVSDESVEDVTERKSPSVAAAAAPKAPLQWTPSSSRKLWADRPASASAAAVGARSPVLGLPPPAPVVSAAPAVPVAAPVMHDEAADVSVPAAKAKKPRKNAAAASLDAILSVAPLAAAAASVAVAAPAAAAPVCPFALGSSSAMLKTFGSCACIPRFGLMPLSDLQKLMATFGLKNRSLNQMAAKLEELWRSIALERMPAGTVLAVLDDPAAAPAAAAAARASPVKEKKRKKKASAEDAPTAAASVLTPLSDITAAASNNAAVDPPQPKAKKRKVQAAVAAPVVLDADQVMLPAPVAPSAFAAAAPAVASAASAALPNAAASSSSLTPDLCGSIRSFLRSQHDLFVRVLLFQPIEVVQLSFLLAEAGVHVNPKALRQFLDDEGVCTSMEAERPKTHFVEMARPRKGGAHVPRKHRRRR